MVQKRSFDQELNELSSKQPRLVRHCDQLAFLGFPHDPIPFKSHSLGEGEADIPFERNFKIVEKFDGRYADDFQSSERRVPHGSANSSTSEEDINPECHYYILLSPEQHNVNIVRSKLIYSSLFRSPPRKLVPIGPDHQADIPPILEHKNNKASPGVEWYKKGLTDDENRLCGTCILPMPKQDPPGCSDDNNSTETGSGGCVCRDAGSIRCIRQHNSEAREKLKRVFGEETFVKLGFDDMGEEVASRWSEEEQELFHDVVFSNPASFGKNFWDNLALEFPSRTKNQIVSYYYNVFMLRRRAEQNRFDPLNIDSDDDEWHGPDYSSEDEAQDSIVESPVHLNDDRNISNEPKNGVNNEQTVMYFPGSKQPLPKGDYSCKGSAMAEQPEVKGGASKELVVEPCHKEWDAEFFGCSPQSRLDLLPTCSMMDEVFGDRDDNGGHHGSS